MNKDLNPTQTVKDACSLDSMYTETTYRQLRWVSKDAYLGKKGFRTICKTCRNSLLTFKMPR
ncbi:MAG: hypothetical protein QW769_01555 [Nitrososphaerales archaeon]